MLIADRVLGFGARKAQAAAVLRTSRAVYGYRSRAREWRPLLRVNEITAGVRSQRSSALALFGIITLVSCSREMAPLRALVGTWSVECAVVEIRDGRKQRAQFGQGDITVSQDKKGVYVPLGACPGGRDATLLLYHDRDDVYRLLHPGSASLLNDRLDIPSTGEGIALRYSEVEGFVAKDESRGILFRSKGTGAYEIRLSKVGSRGEITVTTLGMRLLRE
jgi:hypothetical protein